MNKLGFDSHRVSVFAALALLIGPMMGCSYIRPEAGTQAVEVGNPEDSRPSKPTAPKPTKLLQVELATTQLEEISQVKLKLESVALFYRAKDGTARSLVSRNIKKGDELTVRTQGANQVEFEFLDSHVDSAAPMSVEIKFNPQAPGTVFVNANQFEIEPSADSLKLELTALENARAVAERQLVLPRAFNREELFGPSVARNGEDPGKAPTPGATPTPSPATPVYRLNTNK